MNADTGVNVQKLAAQKPPTVAPPLSPVGVRLAEEGLVAQGVRALHSQDDAAWGGGVGGGAIEESGARHLAGRRYGGRQRA